jgi:hypothetical protein
MLRAVSDAPEQAQRISLRVAPEATPETTRAYANFVQLNFTPHDFTLHFSWFGLPPTIGDDRPESGVIDADTRVVAEITIPLTVARPLLRLLERQTAGWEESFGPLPGSADEPAEEADVKAKPSNEVSP